LFREKGVTSSATNIYHITHSPSNETVSLYFGGCNFDCRGCTRKKMVLDLHLERRSVPAKKQLHFLTFKKVIDALKKVEPKRVLFLGGEPTVDLKLADLAKSIHNEFRACNVLFTNAFVLPSLEDIDEVCVGLKALDNRLHLDYTGKSNRRVLENFVTLHRSNVKLRSESILIPGYIDCEEIGRIAKFIASVDPDIPHIIDAYIPAPGTPWRRPTPREVDKAVKAARKYLNNVSGRKGNIKRRYEVIKIV